MGNCTSYCNGCRDDGSKLDANQFKHQFMDKEKSYNQEMGNVYIPQNVSKMDNIGNIQNGN